MTQDHAPIRARCQAQWSRIKCGFCTGWRFVLLLLITVGAGVWGYWREPAGDATVNADQVAVSFFTTTPNATLYSVCTGIAVGYEHERLAPPGCSSMTASPSALKDAPLPPATTVTTSKRQPAAPSPAPDLSHRRTLLALTFTAPAQGPSLIVRVFVSSFAEALTPHKYWYDVTKSVTAGNQEFCNDPTTTTPPTTSRVTTTTAAPPCTYPAPIPSNEPTYRHVYETTVWLPAAGPSHTSRHRTAIIRFDGQVDVKRDGSLVDVDTPSVTPLPTDLIARTTPQDSALLLPVKVAGIGPLYQPNLDAIGYALSRTSTSPPQLQTVTEFPTPVVSARKWVWSDVYRGDFLGRDVGAQNSADHATFVAGISFGVMGGALLAAFTEMFMLRERLHTHRDKHGKSNHREVSMGHENAAPIASGS